MNDIQNLTTAFSEAKDDLGLSLKDITDIVERFRKEYGPVYEACIMCRTLYRKLREQIWQSCRHEHEFGIGFDFPEKMGMIIMPIEDEDAELIPELGTDNILLGSWLQVWSLEQYIKLLKEKVANGDRKPDREKLE